jgi:elongation factor 1-beta
MLLVVVGHCLNFRFCPFLQFDVTTEKGLAAFNGFMGAKSYVEGHAMTSADTEAFAKLHGVVPDPIKLPHAYRWYVHIAALSGVRTVAVAPPVVAEAAPAPAAAAAPKKAAATEDDDDDFDVFGDDDDDDEGPKRDTSKDHEIVEGGETRGQMMARLKKEAEERTLQKEAKQRTLVAIEIKPWDVEQDLMLLWKKITETIVQDGLKWGENCNLADVAFGIKKIQTTFVMGVSNSEFVWLCIARALAVGMT